jgi:hypothetical protein
MRISGPNFCAGVVLLHGRVIRAAPKLRYMLGWTASRVREYAAYCGWTIDE